MAFQSNAFQGSAFQGGISLTFSELQTEIMDRLNMSSPAASVRIGRAINRAYRNVTTSIGLQLSRRTTVSKAVTMGVSTVTFTNVEKVISVENRSTSPYTRLTTVTLEELRLDMPYPANDSPTKYAIHSHSADTVTIEINRTPQTAFTLYADVHQTVSDLSGSSEPAFPESFHNVLIEAVLFDEYRKLEKPHLAQMAQKEYDRILSDLKFWVIKENALDTYQGKTQTQKSSSGGSGGSSSTVNGATSWTQTGLVTFDRDPSAPFAVTASSAKVDNLDADKLDGFDESAFAKLADNETIAGTWTFNGIEINDSDDSHQYVLAVSNLAADQTVTLPLLTGADEFVFKDHTQTLTNKTLTNPTVNAGSGTIVLPQGTSPAQTAEGSVVWDTDDDLLTVGTGAARKTMVDTNSTQTLTSKTLTSPSMTTPAVTSGAIDLQSGQITFPATQNSSAGANTLDDYEEGSWTPSIGGSGGQSGQTYAANGQVGRYIKVGKKVFVQGYILLTALGTVTTNAQIQGLPFTSENTTNLVSGLVIHYWNALANAKVMVTATIPANTTAATLFAAGAAATGLTVMVQGDLSNTTELYFSGTYRATA
jgi:hypothetical protein